jgi:pyrophosphate--fructose-6-phosphate 1-phosphotransferase
VSGKKADEEIVPSFPSIKENRYLKVIKSRSSHQKKPLRVGCVLSGGQAAGGHNVIIGLFDALQELHPESTLFGFLNGPSGIVEGKYRELGKEELACYRNQGGFDLIGSGRTKIETEEQFEKTLQVMHKLALDGLVIIGGDDSNTNAAYLAEYFIQHGCSTRVIGVPKTIDGDLQSERVAISFGFDTACKVYADSIASIARDAISAKKYYYFIKLMGRSASHIALECALHTQPNLTLIGEEIQEKNMTLMQTAEQIVDLIVERSKHGKQYGMIVIPEGVIEFLSDMKQLVQALNKIVAPTSAHLKTLDNMATFDEKLAYVTKQLAADLQKTLMLIPRLIQEQLLLDRDPHGNVQVSKIETERLYMHIVEAELQKRAKNGAYTGSFSAQPIFFGYEGRSHLPSNFDANYSYSLGRLAALFIMRHKTGYMVALDHLFKPASDWIAYGVPLVTLMHLEERNGKKKAVIKKALVNLKGKSFQQFQKERTHWRLSDFYPQPGPIQFFGPKEVTDTVPLVIQN